MSNQPYAPKPSIEYDSPTPTSIKFVYIAMTAVFIAFLFSIPFMIQDKINRENNAWKTQGCRMYDDFKVADVPAKCQLEFIERYQSQTPVRVQPPEQR